MMGAVCGSEGQEGLRQILLGTSDQVPEGAMHEFEVEGNKILVIRQNKKLSGLSGKCTHYGAPLVKGSLGDGIITCPWHGACFSTETGDIEDFPGCSSLVSYKIVEEAGNVYLERHKDTNLTITKREKFTGSRKVDVEENLVIVGGGAAGHTAIETLRSHKYGGRITLISAEDDLPYDRPKLSKKLDATPQEISLRSREWYEEAGVKLMLGVTVTKVDTEENKVHTQSDDTVSYDKLIYCTGGVPRTLGVEGADLQGVHTLRTPADANTIQRDSVGKNVVVVGGSFIGMEVSAAIVKTAASVTVIDRNSTSFESSLGAEVGAVLQEMHKNNGVKFHMNAEVERITGDEGRVSSVTLKSGDEVAADLVLVGVGVIPSTQPFSHVPGFLNNRGAIPVDEFMKTSVENVWCAGDIVNFPLLTYDREMVTIGHWGLAMYMGKIAALSAMGKAEPAKTVPFFWTVQYGKSVRFAGVCNGCDNTTVHKETESGGFLALYSKDGVVRGVCTLAMDPIAASFRNLIMQGKQIQLETAIQTILELRK